MKPLLVLFLLMLSACESRKAGSPVEEGFKASASITSGAVKITSNEPIDCFQPVVILNGTHRASPADFGPKASATIPYSDFITATGERFNYEKNKPISLVLTCKISNGQEKTGSWHF